jgi:peptide chain release factor 1
MGILRARLAALQAETAAAERAGERRLQVGTGDRSEKIRTYNFPQDRLTDHRIGFSMHGLPKVMAGGLDPILDAVAEAAAGED